jgi:hypothetical protein
MSHQLSILQEDFNDLSQYIQECDAKGKTDLSAKLAKKLNFLNSRIAEMSMQAA